MSAGIAFHCDVASEHGSCPQRIYIGTIDLAAARKAAEDAGWQLSATADRCARYHAPRRTQPRPPVALRRNR